MFDLLQITAQYSNAVLVAIMPHIADCAKQLDLPIQPVTLSQVQTFKCSPRSDLFGGRVILTNGYEFVFLHGHVEMFRDPTNFFELQDPSLAPKYFGTVKLTQKDALTRAHEVIKKLGYTDSQLSADRPPKITPPPHIGNNYVPRYRVLWTNPNDGNPDNPPISAEFEIDGVTGQIHRMYLLNPNTWKEPPKVDVKPSIIGSGPKTEYRNGRVETPVTQKFADAFLSAILPQASNFAAKAGLSVKAPITLQNINLSRYHCALVDDDPNAFVYLKTGEHFIYSHGQVIFFCTADVTHLPGEDWKPVQQFFGPVNITGNQAVSLVRTAIKNLGYSEKALGVDKPPRIVGPPKKGTNTIARYAVNWMDSDGGPFRVTAEVDATHSSVTSLYINDHAITNIWRKPPISILGASLEASKSQTRHDPPGANLPSPSK